MSIQQMLLGASGASGYLMQRSLRFRSSASAYLNRTFGTATSRTAWTYSVWTKLGTLGTNRTLLNVGGLSTNYGLIFLNSVDQLDFQEGTNGAIGRLTTTQVFRDPSAWYNFVFVWDSSNATSSSRMRIYINGVQVTAFLNATYPSSGANGYINSANVHWINAATSSQWYQDGYLAEVNFIDGQALTPASFGETNALTGVWQPKAYTGTYGTNGFYLKFTDNSTAAALGTDFSGNSNTWTVNNISVTAGVTYDSMTDVPTLTSATAANYAVWNPLDNQGALPTIQNGNLDISGLTILMTALSSVGVTSGKWYWEVTLNTSVAGVPQIGIAKQGLGTISTNGLGQSVNAWTYLSNANKGNNNTFTAYGATYTVGDIIGVAFDVDNGTLVFYKNNSSQGTAFTGLTNGPYFPAFGGSSGSSAVACSANFGQRPFTYTPPTGFVALNTYNIDEGTITTSGTFTGNASADGPSINLNGVPTAMTINGNAVTFGTHADKVAYGFKLRTTSSSYNTVGSNTYSVSTTGAKFKYANAQSNP